MCDYSLHAFANRLATDGEDLVVHRFFGGSMGLASPEDVRPREIPPIRASNKRLTWSWSAIRNWFTADLLATENQPCAVCIPPGASLILRDIPLAVQREFDVRESESVTFVQTTASANTYRDALRFSNQRQILLQALRPGQRMTVVRVDLTQEAEGRRAPVLARPRALAMRG